MAEKVWDTYRGLLRQRLQAYQQGGLATLAPYTRSGGGVTDPAADLRAAIADVDRVGRARPAAAPSLLLAQAPSAATAGSQPAPSDRHARPRSRRPHRALLLRRALL